MLEIVAHARGAFMACRAIATTCEVELWVWSMSWYSSSTCCRWQKGGWSWEQH